MDGAEQGTGMLLATGSCRVDKLQFDQCAAHVSEFGIIPGFVPSCLSDHDEPRR